MTTALPVARWLALGSVLAAGLLGLAALWFGVQEGAPALWGFGGACLVQVPPSLSLWAWLGEGLGNRGLERERLTLRGVALAQRILALGVVLDLVRTWDAPVQSFRVWEPILPALGVILFGGLWWAKRSLRATQPALMQDAARVRVLLELAALLLGGGLLAGAHPAIPQVAALVLAFRVFLAGQVLGKATALPAAGCGGCGSRGCG